jgi:hypothetical protein
MKSFGIMAIITSDMRLEIPADLSGYIFLLYMQHFVRPSFKIEYLSPAKCNKMQKTVTYFTSYLGIQINLSIIIATLPYRWVFASIWVW